MGGKSESSPHPAKKLTYQMPPNPFPEVIGQTVGCAEFGETTEKEV